jgi:tetraacyldisaccharide 4'-kinase
MTGVRPVVREILESASADEVVLSTVTRTGQRLAEEVRGVTGAFFLPVDASRPVRRSLGVVDAQTLVVMETEIWPNLLREARRRGMRTAILNGRISGSAFRRYRLFRGFLSEVLENVDFFGVQSETDRERFVDLGARADRVRVLGSSKYDAIATGRDETLAGRLAHLLGDRSSLPVWVAGCVRPGEEMPVLDAYARVEAKQPHTLVIAPRHLERVQNVQEEVSGRGLRGVRWTQLGEGARPDGPVQVVILDTIGDLGRFYGLAALSFVGGGLAPLGGHNPLEPAAFGVPVVFGRHMDNYRLPADALADEGGGVEVNSTDELAAAVETWVTQPAARARAGRQALRVVEGYRGAAHRQVQALREMEILPGPGGDAGPSSETRTFTPGRTRVGPRMGGLLSSFHQGLSALNRGLYRIGLRRSENLDVPVVSVGNLSLGGTGKTPMVVYITRRYLASGRRVGILTRGYRRTAEHDEPLTMDGSTSPPGGWKEVGDEPWWLADQLEGAAIVVGRNRTKSGRHAIRTLGCDLLVLDDGFQHARLGRDLDIVLMDSGAWTERGGFSGEHWLREGLSALSRAHGLVLVHRAGAEAPSLRTHLAATFPHLRLAECRYRPTGFRDLSTGESVPLSAVDGEVVVPVCGLASPEKFEGTVESLGARIGDRWRFPDHHEFTPAEIAAVTKRVQKGARWAVTTEKDAVRLASLPEQPIGWLVLSVDLQFVSGEADFGRMLDAVGSGREGRCAG